MVSIHLLSYPNVNEILKQIWQRIIAFSTLVVTALIPLLESSLITPARMYNSGNILEPIKKLTVVRGTMGENIAAGYSDPLDTSIYNSPRSPSFSFLFAFVSSFLFPFDSSIDNQWICDSTGSCKFPSRLKFHSCFNCSFFIFTQLVLLMAVGTTVIDKVSNGHV